MRLLLGSFIITYNVEHILLLALGWAALAWFEMSPSPDRRSRDGGPHSLKSRMHTEHLKDDGTLSWQLVLTETLLGFLVGIVARYVTKRTYPLGRLFGRLRVYDNWVLGAVVVMALVIAVGLFGYDDMIKLEAKEDSELFPIGRIRSLLIGLALYYVAYTLQSHWLHWNWFEANQPERATPLLNANDPAMVARNRKQRQEFVDQERALSLWLLAQGSVYALLIIVDILLVQSARLSLRMALLFCVFIATMATFQGLARLW